MLNLPLVSVIVTSYNYAQFVEKTLCSIKNQTYSNFEILIVDDASKDNSKKIIENFISENQNLKITLFEQPQNMGQMAAMWRGLKNANGQFVCFIDSDDILMPDFIQTHIKIHLQTSVAFTSCRIIEIGKDEEVHTLNSISSPPCKNIENIFNFQNSDFEIVKGKFGGWYWAPNSSAMYRKASIEQLLNYKNTGKWKICPDKFVMNFAHLIGGSAIVSAPLLGYRRHTSNAGNSNTVTGNKRLHSDKITITNINNNIKIRPETIKFLWTIRKNIGKRNTVKLISTVLLSYFI